MPQPLRWTLNFWSGGVGVLSWDPSHTLNGNHVQLSQRLTLQTSTQSFFFLLPDFNKTTLYLWHGSWSSMDICDWSVTNGPVCGSHDEWSRCPQVYYIPFLHSTPLSKIPSDKASKMGSGGKLKVAFLLPHISWHHYSQPLIDNQSHHVPSQTCSLRFLAYYLSVNTIIFRPE